VRVLGFADYRAQGEALAAALGVPFSLIEVHRFPDGESKVTVPGPLSEEVVICRSLDHPNDKLIELLLAAQTARELGAKKLTLVAPYLCYMRQDIAFHPGEAVSQRIVGDWLAQLFDKVVTVDPHLHRIDRLEQAIPGREAIALAATGPMGEFLAEKAKSPILVGPDAESEQWVRAMAEPAGLQYLIAHKERRGDREVEITLPECDYRGHEVILVDDMISTGHTIADVAVKLKQAGAGTIHCLVTHALFTEDVATLLYKAGVERIWSSDSVSHSTNAVHLADLLATAIRE
jgi:ribose-phosphate pyrophosphokinase